VVADVRHGFEHAQVRVTGRDVYALAAVTVADAALTLAASAHDERGRASSGVRSPSELSLAGETLAALEAAGALALTASFSRPSGRETVLETSDVRSP
jgi:hypothetical protein